MADPFALLNAAVARAFGQRTVVTYLPGAAVPGFQIQGILDTTREMDETPDSTYQELFLDGNDPLLTTVVPQKGDMFVTPSGYQYLVHRIDVDTMNGINIIGRLKVAPITAPNKYGSRPY